LQAELASGSGEKLYYESAAVEALEKWKKMSEEEKRAAKAKGDEIDALHTSDLEQYIDKDEDDPGYTDLTLDFYEENDINLARAFLGYDGGYSIRKLKKFMKRDKTLNQQEEVEAKEE
jgi:hypothetical protein